MRVPPICARWVTDAPASRPTCVMISPRITPSVKALEPTRIVGAAAGAAVARVGAKTASAIATSATAIRTSRRIAGLARVEHLGRQVQAPLRADEAAHAVV